MLPVLIDTGGFRLHTYGAMGALGFVVLAVLALRKAKARGLDTNAVTDLMFWTAIAGIAGARLLFAWQNPGTLTSPLALLDLRGGGMVFYGALLALPVGFGVARWRGLPLLATADLFAPLFPLAHGLARLGCLGAGCCYGRPTELPWGLVYTHPLALAPRDVPLHPVQVYEAAGLFGLSWALSRLAVRRRFGGEVLLGWLAGYAVLRLVTETFRGDADRYFVLEAWLGAWVSTSQAIALGFLVLVAVAWRRLERLAPAGA